MDTDRINDIYRDFKEALNRLKEALVEDLGKGDIIIDGTIQRFEFSFELAWKLARAILYFNGIEADTPKSVIKEAFKIKMIDNGDGWIDMLEDRNKTSHIYDKDTAQLIYNKIKERHFGLLDEFAAESIKFYSS